MTNKNYYLVKVINLSRFRRKEDKLHFYYSRAQRLNIYKDKKYEK